MQVGVEIVAVLVKRVTKTSIYTLVTTKGILELAIERLCFC